ncbi:proteasome assembly chaperone family protein [Rhizohabitans arisaemae]|uniref:proteasome assembly chaperone family protein n=1 Tax=Rhizohabitans arisaemae TaxID=2720610 RepID=UPI0024B13496|nr:PAC2 family protein [Rhizohabitans arisaemae]
MLDPTDLYELSDDVPDLTDPVLLCHLDGFVDAGSAGRLAASHLLDGLEHRVVARFDTDRLLDYRARRPVMVYDADHWESYTRPELVVYAVRDTVGLDFLLLTGLEPDREWERFTAAVRGLVKRLGVRLTATFHGIPMAVPHTRPISVIAHATRPELVASYRPWMGKVQVPGSAAALLELRLGEEGHDAMGFAVQVPHYLAQTEYPHAALAVLETLSLATGLTLPMDGLRESADRTLAEIESQIADSPEISSAVTGLEEQYDAYTRAEDRGSLMAEEPGTVPTADELGAQFERFLAEQDRRNENPGGDF